MKLLYLDCGMGAAGDMLTAALLELFDNREQMLEKLNALGLSGIRYLREDSVKCGILGSHVRVLTEAGEEGEHPDHHADGEHHHHHAHSSLEDILRQVDDLKVSPAVKERIREVFTSIAQAESRVHGEEIQQIHFHEVGSLDAVADVTAVCFLLDALGNPRVVASPVHVGTGTVRCAHGVLPVPAPATALLLERIPTYGGEIQGELCTPTGAALLRSFAQSFGPQPPMLAQKIGYGCGKKDFPRGNFVRAILGESLEAGDEVLELRCNLDDMTGEEMGFATEELLHGGALDVWTTPIYMKKNRPGVLLTLLCRESDREKMTELLFTHTTTLGIRWELLNRQVRPRFVEREDTPYGPVRKKISQGREKYEFEDLAAIARREGKSLFRVRQELENQE